MVRIVDSKRYNVVTVNGAQMYEHHTILPPKLGYDVDHINGDGKDNRPENLRYLPRSKNAIHRFTPTAGIDFIFGKWRARLAGKHLGMFISKELAIIAREQAIKELLDG